MAWNDTTMHREFLYLIEWESEQTEHIGDQRTDFIALFEFTTILQPDSPIAREIQESMIL